MQKNLLTLGQCVEKWGCLETSNKSDLDVCITGINRPDVLDKTLHSFFNRILNQWSDPIAIVNIDPYPNLVNQDIFLKILKKYFKSGLVRFPEHPDFANAVKWVWESSKSDKIFHLEDDWLCLIPLSRTELECDWKKCEFQPVQILLPKVTATRDIGLKGFSLNPSFIDGRWARNMAKNLKVSLDPEKQIRHPDLGVGLPHAVITTVIFRPKVSGPIVFDSGAIWKRREGIKKTIDENRKVSWVFNSSSKKIEVSHKDGIIGLIDRFGPLFSVAFGMAQRMKDGVRVLLRLTR